MTITLNEPYLSVEFVRQKETNIGAFDFQTVSSYSLREPQLNPGFEPTVGEHPAIFEGCKETNTWSPVGVVLLPQSNRRH